MNKEKKILYLSPTKAGKIHDFKQFKKIAVIDRIIDSILLDIEPILEKQFSKPKKTAEQHPFC